MKKMKLLLMMALFFGFALSIQAQAILSNDFPAVIGCGQNYFTVTTPGTCATCPPFIKAKVEFTNPTIADSVKVYYKETTGTEAGNYLPLVFTNGIAYFGPATGFPYTTNAFSEFYVTSNTSTKIADVAIQISLVDADTLTKQLARADFTTTILSAEEVSISEPEFAPNTPISPITGNAIVTCDTLSFSLTATANCREGQTAVLRVAAFNGQTFGDSIDLLYNNPSLGWVKLNLAGGEYISAPTTIINYISNFKITNRTQSQSANDTLAFIIADPNTLAAISDTVFVIFDLNTKDPTTLVLTNNGDLLNTITCAYTAKFDLVLNANCHLGTTATLQLTFENPAHADSVQVVYYNPNGSMYTVPFANGAASYTDVLLNPSNTGRFGLITKSGHHINNVTIHAVVLNGSDNTLIWTPVTDIVFNLGLPKPEFSFADLTICSPSKADLTTLTLLSGDTTGLAWTYQDQNHTPVVDPMDIDQSGVYYIIGTNIDNCSDTSAVLVSINVCTPNLGDLTISTGTLDPVFESNTLNYTLLMPCDQDSVVLTLTAETQSSVIEVDDVRYTSPANVTVKLNGVTQKTVNVEIIAADSNRQAYRIKVIGKPEFSFADTSICSPNMANLTTLKLASGDTTGLTLLYTDMNYDTIDDPIDIDQSGIYYIIGTNINGCSDTSSVLISINVCSPQLEDITVNNGTLDPAFDPEVTSYTLLLPCGLDSVTLVVTSETQSSTLKIDSVEYESPATVTIKFAEPGEKDVNIVVADEKTYTVKVIRPFSGVIMQAWNDVLTVINNPSNNGNQNFIAYQWRENGVDMAGETKGNLYLANNPNASTATYSVLLTTDKGHKAQSCDFKLNTTNAKNSILKVYPNPVNNGLLTIDNPLWEKNSYIEIYDLSSKYLGKYAVDSERTILDMSNLSKGTYLLKINNETIKVIHN